MTGRLSDIERGRSKGVAVVYYEDGDYRCLWFNALSIVEDEEDSWSVDGAKVLEVYVPDFQRKLANVRAEPGEPKHALYEVYWERELVWQEEAPAYEPVPLEEV